MPTAKMTANIVGSSFYPNAGNIISRLRPGAKLVLKREPTNKFDKNAVAVFFNFSGNLTQLGHLSRGLAELLAPKLDKGVEVTAKKAPILGGVITLEWDQGEEAETPSADVDALTARFRGLVS